MVRRWQPGSYAFYVVERCVSTVGPREVWRRVNEFHEPKPERPAFSFNASGEVWQRTGVHGTHSLRHALATIQHCAEKYGADVPLRVRALSIEVKDEIICTVCATVETSEEI